MQHTGPQRGGRGFFIAPLDDLSAALEAAVLAAQRRGRAVAWLAAGMVVAWWVYVPVHELLHALGCYATGGTVRELQIAPEYGAALLARVFPFVVPGGPYAGRLSGFETYGSDVVYLATDALPFVLTILVGVPLLRHCRQPSHPWWCGAAVVLAVAPFYSVTGDYYEMGSIVVTRAAGAVSGAGVEPYAPLRGDDLTQVIHRVWADPATVVPTLSRPAALALVGLGAITGTLLAFATYAAGRWAGQAFGVGSQ